MKEGVAFATCAICLAPQMTPTGEGSMPTITIMDVQTSEGVLLTGIRRLLRPNATTHGMECHLGSRHTIHTSLWVGTSLATTQSRHQVSSLVDKVQNEKT